MDLNGEVPGAISPNFPGDVTVGGNLDVSGKVLLADGKVSAPSLTFQSDQDTGMYLNPLTGAINFARDGVATASINSFSIASAGNLQGYRVFEFTPSIMETHVQDPTPTLDGFGFLTGFSIDHEDASGNIEMNGTTGIATLVDPGLYKFTVTTRAGTSTELKDGNVALNIILYKNGDAISDEYNCPIVPASGLTASPLGTSSWTQTFTTAGNDQFQIFATYDNYDGLIWQSTRMVIEFVGEA